MIQSSARPSLLVVEDDPVVAEDLRHIVERSGARVTGIANNAELALEMARHTEPTLALVDIRLAGEKDGIEAAESLHKLGVGVLYLTAHSDRTTLQRATETEPVGFLTKPFSEAELLRGISIGLRLVSARKREQGERQQLLDVLACMNDGVALFGPGGSLRFTNPALTRLLAKHTPEMLADLLTRTLQRSEPLVLDGELNASCVILDGNENVVLIVRSNKQSELSSVGLSMCAYCRRVRGEQNAWQPIEAVLASRYGLLVSHGLCEQCLARHFESETESNRIADSKPNPPRRK